MYNMYNIIKFLINIEKKNILILKKYIYKEIFNILNILLHQYLKL